MVEVRLTHDWTDEDGVTHLAGETVDVDPTTLNELQTLGWVGMTGDEQTGRGPS